MYRLRPVFESVRCDLLFSLAVIVLDVTLPMVLINDFIPYSLAMRRTALKKLHPVTHAQAALRRPAVRFAASTVVDSLHNIPYQLPYVRMRKLINYAVIR
jgi:hypothetical protein